MPDFKRKTVPATQEGVDPTLRRESYGEERLLEGGLRVPMVLPLENSVTTTLIPLPAPAKRDEALRELWMAQVEHKIKRK